MITASPRMRHIASSRFPLKHAWDLLAMAQLLARGNVATRVRLSLEQNLRCIKFYFDADGINRLWAGTSRSGSHWSQLSIELVLDLANGGRGVLPFR